MTGADILHLPMGDDSPPPREIQQPANNPIIITSLGRDNPVVSNRQYNTDITRDYLILSYLYEPSTN
jgi:hypothetical protein